MKILSHLRTQPFLAAVSLAAALHSSWSFSTLFTGLEPHPQFTPSWFAWIIPGVMLAFSVDIGLLTLANQIRLGQRTKGKLLAFAVLCGAMGFLQFLYIASHMPEVQLGAGVRLEWVGLVSLMRDASIWILPLLLPVALALFAFSETKPASEPMIEPMAVITLPDLHTMEGRAWLHDLADVLKTQHDIAEIAAESEIAALPESPLLVSPNGHGETVNQDVTE